MTSKNWTPSKVQEYLDPNYWTRRFEEEEEFEWCKSYADFKHLLGPLISDKSVILILGCGNSRLADDLYGDGFHNIICMDIAIKALEGAEARQSKAGVQCVQHFAGDMLALPLRDKCVDVVLDKGSLEVLWVDAESQWDPGEKVMTRVSKAIREVYRVLTDTGKLVSLSFGQPHFRKPAMLLPGLSWQLDVQTYGEVFHYFCYTF